MRLATWVRLSGIAFGLSLSALVSAAPINFANFNDPLDGEPFSFTNNGGTSASMSTSTQITFNFTAPTGLSIADRPATLTISGPPTFLPSIGLGAGMQDQPISNVTTMHITENSTGKNLLTMLFTGDIEGRLNGAISSLSGTDTTGQTVNFTSDYLNFTPPGNSYILSLAQMTPLLSVGPGGFLNSFVADITGQFSGNATPVPEPMFGGSLLACGAIALFRRGRSN